MPAAITRIRKYMDLSVKVSQKVAINPATFPAMAFTRNQHPIIKAVIRGGDNFDTIDKPIGLMRSSPSVNKA